jgi:hypothetical protein
VHGLRAILLLSFVSSSVLAAPAPALPDLALIERIERS